MSIDQYSTTPSNNDLTNYFKTGMRPSSVKNAGWDIMADIASYLVSLPASAGTANAMTVVNGRPFGALVTGLLQILKPTLANTGPATFAPDGLTAKSIFANGSALVGGEIQPNVPAYLKYDGTQWNLWNPAPPGRNAFIDPCCRVAQIGFLPPSLSTSYKYGVVDLVSCKASGTAVSAGVISQDTTGVIASASTPYSAKLTGVTITGTGKVFFRKWCESKDAIAFINGYGIFGLWCRHDVVGSVPSFLTANAFQSQDSPGTPVQIATGSGAPVSVASGTDTFITLAVPNMSVAGTVANGFELILEMDCGAITTKNFYATDWQACLKTLAQKCAVPRFEDDLSASMRYYEQSYEYGTSSSTSTQNGCLDWWQGGTVAAGGGVGAWNYKVPKLIAPTVTIWGDTGTSGSIRDVSGAGNKAATVAADKAAFNLVSTPGITGGDHFRFQYVADGRL